MLPTSNAVARDFGAFIVPIDGDGGAGRVRAVERFPLLGSAGLSIGARDVLSALGLPDFLRAERPRATRRAGGADADAGVLGEQVTIPRVGDGDGLSFGQLPLLALALVLLSSLLLVAAVLPPAAVARTPVPEPTYDRLRQPFALAAIGILFPVAFVALLAVLS